MTQRCTKSLADYIKAGVSSDDFEDMYAAVHEAIRADPSAAKKKTFKADPKFKKEAKRSLQQRQARVAQKKAHAASKN